MTIYINGKFLAQRTTGVQRFAHGIVRALDLSLQLSPCSHNFELLLPPNTLPIPRLYHIRQRSVGHPRCSLTAWEQIYLPIYTRGATLLCLSGSAPLLVGSCIPTIHDAAVYLFPNAYSHKFVAWYRLLFAIRAKCSSLVLTVSESSARDLAVHLPHTSYRVIPNSAEHINFVASDLKVLDHLGLTPGKFLLAVGSLNPTKNFLSLINSYSASSLRDRLPLVIVGAMNRDVFSPVSVGVADQNIRWAGSLSDAQLRALYENATVFIFPSIYEGFGIPPLEAMFCGCPVVASKASSIPEVCGDAADYFDPFLPNDMVSAIHAVIDSEDHRCFLIEKGRNRATEFRWENSVIKLRAALAEFGFIDK